MKPLTGCIEFFEDVFDHAIFAVHGSAAVILPATHITYFVGCVFTGDAVVIATPV